jgi:hypothetical protein
LEERSSGVCSWIIVAVWRAAGRVLARRRRFVEMRVSMREEEVQLECESEGDGDAGCDESRKEGRCRRSWVSKSGRGSKMVTRVSGRRRCMASMERPMVPPPRRAMWWGYSDIVR